LPRYGGAEIILYLGSFSAYQAMVSTRGDLIYCVPWQIISHAKLDVLIEIFWEPRYVYQ